MKQGYWAVLSCGTVYYAVQGDSNVWVCGWNPIVWPFKWKLLSSTFLCYCLLFCSNFWDCRWNPKVWPFKWKLLSSNFSCGTVYYAVQGGSNFWVRGWNSIVWAFKLNLFCSAFLLYCLFHTTLQPKTWWDFYFHHFYHRARTIPPATQAAVTVVLMLWVLEWDLRVNSVLNRTWRWGKKILGNNFADILYIVLKHW